MHHTPVSTLGAQKFPLAASSRISLSSVRFATARFSRAFSFSRSFRWRAWLRLARADVQHMNEGSANSDWNPIWDVRTARFEGGWSVEMQIPFKSLRYRPGTQQIWGVQLRRSIRRKNEWAHLTLIPRSAVRGSSGSTAIIRVSRHGTLVGLEAPEASRNIEIKPYGISGTRTDRTTSPPVNDDGFWDAGLDIRYGVTENLSADLTFDTDFAQVEVDEQQVNLTRFQLFFPEKRDFFLEGRGVYDFAAATFTAGASSRNTPTLFFSRRIGLDGGVVVPILAGARLTGKVGPANVGALSIQTRDEPKAEVESTNFTVLRVRQDLLRRSSLGALFASRSASTVAAGANHTFGVDGTFSFFQDLYLATYYAETRTSALSGDDQSYLARVSYSPDLWGVALEHLNVGQNFNPEIGFVRRRGFRETTASARYSPRPASIEAIRRFSLEGNFSDLHLLEQRVRGGRTANARFQIEFESSDVIGVAINDEYELIEDDFRISDGVIIPPGGYSYRDVEASLNLGLHRRFAGDIAVRRGSFYDGDRTTMEFTGGRLNMSDQLSLEPSVSLNWVDLPQGSFQTNVAVTRVFYSLFAAVVSRWPHAVQLREPHPEHELPAPVGIPPRKRAVRGLYGEPRYGCAGSVFRARESWPDRQDELPREALAFRTTAVSGHPGPRLRLGPVVSDCTATSG